MAGNKGFYAIVLISSLLVICGLYIGPLTWVVYSGENDLPGSENTDITIWIAWLWIALFVTAIFLYRMRALWLLLGGPFVLFWPCMWIFVARGCSIFGNCR